MRMNDTATIIILSALGVAGVVSFRPALPDLLRRLAHDGRRQRILTRVLSDLALAQASLVVIACAYAGARLGPPLGLRSALLEPGVRLTWSLLARLLLPGLLAGILGAVVAFRFAKPLLSYFRGMPLATRLLYGGFTEEVIVRWGLMTAVVWLLSLVTPAGLGAAVAAGIVATNAAFAAAHVPMLRAAKTPSPRRAALVIFLASLPWGWLFWRYGIESAIAAHVAFHAFAEALAVRDS